MSCGERNKSQDSRPFHRGRQPALVKGAIPRDAAWNDFPPLVDKET